jgi:hypothetical protein
VGIATLLAGAVGVRMWLMLSYGPGFLGYPDSGEYAWHVLKGSFDDIQHPGGYSLFLRFLHFLSDRLAVTIDVQHVIGVATGLLLYKAVRRTGAPPWLGLLPAAIVFFGATGLFLEHSLLSDSLFTFLQALALYLAIRTLYDRRLRWAALTGLVLGLCLWVRGAATANAIIIPVLLLVAAPGGMRRRLLAAVVAASATLALLFAYVGAQYAVTGYVGYVRQSPWALYARVTTFVNCANFTPPAGTEFLCPREPPGHRQSQDFYILAPQAPAVKRLGAGDEANPRAYPLLKAFSVAAIEQEPGAYVETIAAGLGRYVFPRTGEGDTPEILRQQLLQPVRAEDYELGFDPVYPGSRSYAGPASTAQALATYESYTSVRGPFLILLLTLAAVGPFLLPARMRWAAALFTLAALVTSAFAVAGLGYDARYAYPTSGPLAAGAALGAWGIRLRLAAMVRRKGPIASAPAVNDPRLV